jgi:hypothetical protein
MGLCDHRDGLEGTALNRKPLLSLLLKPPTSGLSLMSETSLLPIRAHRQALVLWRSGFNDVSGAGAGAF